MSFWSNFDGLKPGGISSLARCADTLADCGGGVLSRYVGVVKVAKFKQTRVWDWARNTRWSDVGFVKDIANIGLLRSEQNGPATLLVHPDYIIRKRARDIYSVC